jgi:hypothetical protein
MKLSAFSPESVGSGFLSVQEQMTVGDFLAALLVSLAAAAAASLFYRFFYERRGTGSQIHRAFPLLALAVTTLFIGVQLSLPLSLGLLGSLSIIRFRTPIKEPEEVGFIMLVIAAAICAATKQFAFILYLYLFALAALVVARFAAAVRWLRRGGVLVLTLPADDAIAKSDEIERVLADHLPRYTLESASTRDGMATNQYVFGGLRDAAALQKALRETAPFSAVNVFLDRPGGIR